MISVAASRSPNQEANQREMGKLAALLFGSRLDSCPFALVEWLFVKLLGIIYLIAFVSLGVQILGLVGAQGILPIEDYLRTAHQYLGARAYWQAPTLFWLNSSNAALQGACVAGALLAVVLIVGYAQRAILIALFVLYLSLVHAGQIFLAYQWDSLLLEAGFLAIFLGDSLLVVWLFRWLVFRLMFLSGATKLLSGDPTWRTFTALNYHYETQPLPTPLAWFMHQLPQGFQMVSVAVVFFVELAVPFLIVAPRARRLRIFAACTIILLQVLIFLTGNYTFFNLLTMALCVFLLDDAALPGWFSEHSQPLRRIFNVRSLRFLTRTWGGAGIRSSHPASSGRPWAAQWVAVILAGIILFASGSQLLGIFTGRLPRPSRYILTWMAPLRIVNTYGLFAVMTTSRPEIVIEGSNDRQTWLAYEFKYKPGDVGRGPSWVAPHQPRLDWQMWFAALGGPDADRLLVNLMNRLQQGSPDVLALLDYDPFPDAPPRYIRARMYNYHFTDFATLRAEDAWWRRVSVGVYSPAAPLINP